MIRLAALAALALLPGAPVPAGRMVAVEGARRIHLSCAGKGAPTIVFTAGAGMTATTWERVRAGVPGRSCAWDRAGFGASDASPERQTAPVTTRDLDRALAAAGERGPFVLVGHSIGAYETLLYADRHPARVVGMVLVDPSVPDQFRGDSGAVVARLTAPFRACVAALAAGAPPPPGCDPARGIARAETALSFYEAIPDSARAVVNPRRNYGAMPLVVLTAGPSVQTAWSAAHDALAALSTRGIHRHVPDSGHMMQRERPEAIIAAVAEIVSLSRHTTTR